MRLGGCSFLISTCIICGYLEKASLVQAQITSDNTLPTTVTTTDNLNFIIAGGNQAGGNLFQSFDEFSVPTGGSTVFLTPYGVQNIISRVTGGSISNINGLIQANGSANLFLINPNGIVFGRNARLDIGGSFIASTANRINFSDGNFFSAADPTVPPLLTVSTPIGLHLGNSPGAIRNQSQVLGSEGYSVGLQVPSGKTLGLVGGDVVIEGSSQIEGINITVLDGGRIELGSVRSGLVSLTPVMQGWALGYEGVQDFKDIQLLQGGRINTSGFGSGKIQVKGRLISLTDNSGIFSFNEDNNGGAISVSAEQLILRDGSRITVGSFGAGRSGNLTVTADSIELSGSSDISPSGLFAQTVASGRAGDLTVNTRTLTVRDGAQVSTSTSGSGQGGALTVNASEAINLIGKTADGEFFSALLTESRGSLATGNAGTLEINTRQLTLQDGAEINASSTGTGNAGNLEVTANSMRVEDGGKLTATSKFSSDGGNINLQNLDLLTLRNSGEISTSAEGAGDGGNINIDTDNLVLAERSKITAKAVDGRGGNISITTQGLFVSPDSTIDASSDRGINGIVEIRRPDVDPSAELVILPADVVDVSALVAQGCSVGSVASGESSFAIAGRGGLPPTPAETTRSDSILADLGITEKSSRRLPNGFGNISRVKVRSQKSKAISAPAEISNKVNPAPLVEATGWVVGSNGEVILTASVITDTLNIPWFRPNSCNGT
ncbi:filamentous hemagglutinin N-terminal domain-containing protein [Chroococcidiopsis sp. FACHB-1243]|uniref:two-partner secretion domain-containing protein n=1 Tax=Chroococcidiopsis sp. [FACHB-1243] TaxID=2692781 RepID=UPI00178573A5|nr:filamentous hemagglutinin N-terminal domain-containing protein [Chroococcidiopsis sp. [FACHB-1243]]MBD2304254.1 filamentous hemagglutinin N-terminal domain-containing protein [Chroococcidiopsis sp. [FACHB-1243]]